jgi:hypothetical protein
MTYKWGTLKMVLVTTAMAGINVAKTPPVTYISIK